MVLFLTAVVHNAFFYKHDGVASHNFAYNISFFIPLTFGAFWISCAVVGVIAVKWRKLPNLKMKLVALTLTLPILIVTVWNVLRIMRIH
jgi:hypothetical protein